MSAAAGRVLPLDGSHTILVNLAPVQLPGVTHALNAGGITEGIELPPTTTSCGGYYTPPPPEPDTQPTQWYEHEYNCSHVEEEGVWQYDYCRRRNELYGDGDSSGDYWSAGQWVSGKVLDTCDGFGDACPRMRELGVRAEPKVPVVNWARPGGSTLAPYFPDQDLSSSQCVAETTTFSIGANRGPVGGSVAYTSTYTRCEQWDKNSGSPGYFANAWKDGGVYVGDADRAAVALQGVETAERQDMHWSHSAYLSWEGYTPCC